MHPPRNGGKSIEDIIFNKKPGQGSSCHRQITSVLQHSSFINSVQDINSYYKFMFCRNPWDRAVSLYCWWVTYGPGDPGKFIDWVRKLITGHIHSLKPQIGWIKHKNEIIKFDFLGRFENYEEDFNKLCKNLDMDLKLPHHWATKHEHYSTYYNDESYKLITEAFREDIEYFSYKFEEKYKGSKISIHPWEVVIEPSSKKVKKQ